MDRQLGDLRLPIGEDSSLTELLNGLRGARVRENMKVLKGSAEENQLLQRYTQQLNEEETRLANSPNPPGNWKRTSRPHRTC